jgi:UDP-2,3-diacylglucosamine hydrolase
VSREGEDWIFISDAHFTGKDPGEMESFIRFTGSQQKRMAHLVILGDFFEFFFGFKKTSGEGGFPFSDYLPVLEHLRALHGEGIRISYFEGNHDFCLGGLFPEYFGMDVDVHQEKWECRLGGKRAYVAHGDLSNPGQWAYRFLRRFLKNRLTYGFIRWTGPELARRIARTMSEISHHRSHDDMFAHPPPAFRTFAHHKFLEGFEVVILGHSHFPDQAEEWIDGRRHLYFNVGDWAVHRSYLRFVPPEQFELGRFGKGI